MRRFTALFLAAMSALTLSACANAELKTSTATETGALGNNTKQQETSFSNDTGNPTEEATEMDTIEIIINGQTFRAELYANTAAQQFKKLFPLHLNMADLHDNEKYFYFSDDFDTTDEEIKEIHAGDIFIYDKNCLVLFYESFKTEYSYTPLGRISDTSGLKKAFGTGAADVSFSIVDTVDADNRSQNFVNDISFNFETKTVILNSGYEMPIAGIGTYSLHGDTCVDSIVSALEQGVRLIDTAYMYGNEEEVGEAIRKSNVPREEIFVITKIYPGEQFQNPEKAIQDALDKLDIGYIDMMLLHHPGDNDVNVYKSMEKFVEQGKIRSLGLSNWYIEEIDDFIAQVNIKPALVQNEIHPYYQEQKVIPYMHDLGIVMQAWYPLGGRGHQSELLNDKTILEIAEKHGKSAAQVILRRDLQNGVVVIPGSSNPAHILENISLFDFELTDEEMEKIAKLDRNEKHDWY